MYPLKSTGVPEKTGLKLINKMIMEISVLFFGVLAEVTGTNRRTYTGITSYSDLRHRIEDDYPAVIHYNYRIAVNNEIVNDDPELRNGDEAALLPPFAGG